MHNFVHHLFQGHETDRAFLKSFCETAGKFAPIERLMRAIAFHHPQIGALDFFVSCEAISAAQTLATPANAGTIPRFTGIDDLVITRAALGATHSIERFNNTPYVVESIILVHKSLEIRPIAKLQGAGR